MGGEGEKEERGGGRTLRSRAYCHRRRLLRRSAGDAEVLDCIIDDRLPGRLCTSLKAQITGQVRSNRSDLAGVQFVLHVGRHRALSPRDYNRRSKSQMTIEHHLQFQSTLYRPIIIYRPTVRLLAVCPTK